MEIQLAASFRTATRPTQRVYEVAAMFGLGVDETHEITVVPPTTLRLAPGRVVLVTGASGGGKSTLLRKARAALQRRPDVRVLDFIQSNQQADERAALVDRLARFGGSLTDAVRWLSLAGLNDAAVMLRHPDELSDGQRYRLHLAEAIAAAEGDTESALTVVLADEFGATLDRLTAAVVARNIRKWTRRAGVCFIAATTHDDLLEPLEPDTLIVQQPGNAMQTIEREQCDANDT